jgi:hypothetical protein
LSLPARLGMSRQGQQRDRRDQAKIARKAHGPERILAASEQ